MVFKVIVHAFGTPRLRYVSVPSDELVNKSVPEILELVFHYGQNDFQPMQCPSVSVRDFVLYEDGVYVVSDFGFKELEKVN